VDEIWNEHPDGIFLGAEDMHRQELTRDELEAMAMEDEDGREIPIYLQDGFQIQRRLGMFTRESGPLLPQIKVNNFDWHCNPTDLGVNASKKVIAMSSGQIREDCPCLSSLI